MVNTTKYTPKKGVRPSNDRKGAPWNSNLYLLQPGPTLGTAGAADDSKFYWERRTHMTSRNKWSAYAVLK